MSTGRPDRVFAPSPTAVLDVLAKVVLLASLALVLIDPAWGNLEGKAPTARALTYPLLAFALPVLWTVRRTEAPFPWLPDLLLTAIGFSDVLGNRFDLFDHVGWFDDVMHLLNVSFVSAALVLLTMHRTETLGALLERCLAVGMTAALGWELFEYVAYIMFSPEQPTAYVDTLGDLSMGWLGAVVVALLVHHAWRHHLPVRHDAARRLSRAGRAGSAGRASGCSGSAPGAAAPGGTSRRPAPPPR